MPFERLNRLSARNRSKPPWKCQIICRRCAGHVRVRRRRGENRGEEEEGADGRRRRVTYYEAAVVLVGVGVDAVLVFGVGAEYE